MASTIAYNCDNCTGDIGEFGPVAIKITRKQDFKSVSGHLCCTQCITAWMATATADMDLPTQPPMPM